MHDERLQFLLQRHFDQLLTAEERQELEQMLLASAHARDEFWSAARWHGLLRQWGETEWGRRDAQNPSFLPLPGMPAAVLPPPRRRFPRPGRALATATVVLFAALAGLFLFFYQNRPPAQINGIAVVTGISEDAWATNGSAVQVGETLRPGELRLDRGAVQIQLSRGARVVLEAPVELQLISANEVFLQRGRLSAHVPGPARGFKIGTAEFSVVDHGTELGCILDDAGAAQIHVFAGSVTWEPGDQSTPRRELKKNQALRISHQSVQAVPSDRSLFLSEAEFARLDAARTQALLARWRESRNALRDNPATLVYLDFEREAGQDGMLRNTAAGAPANSEASVVGCERTSGRWPGKGAVEFSRAGDRVRLTAPGTFPALTLLAWIRVDSLPNRQQSLAMAENFELGETHWYIFRDGALALGVHTDTPGQMHGWRNYHSPPVFNRENFGTWRLVASTCDSATGVVSHYLDGRLISSFNRGIKVPMQLGTFEIGNWGVRPDDPRLASFDWGLPQDVIRNYHGRMDEFAILSTALNAADIEKIYRAGHPGETILAEIGQPQTR